MTISVLMSTYKRENADYLNTALDSIWTQQTRRPDQIVLVEDGSLVPELYAVIDKWKAIIGPPLCIVANPVNQGLAAALNDGIRHVTGELVARMDSDDISLPDRFRLQELYMEQHPEVDILGGSLQEFNDTGTLHNIRHYPRTMPDVLQYMCKASPLGHPSVMFRRRFFDDGYRYSSRFHICEDVTLWYDAACGGRVMNNIGDVILKFRRNDAMLYRRAREKAWNEFKAYTDGISRLNGTFTTKHLYSLARLIFRLMPVKIVRKVYNSKIRNSFTNK